MQAHPQSQLTPAHAQALNMVEPIEVPISDQVSPAWPHPVNNPTLPSATAATAKNRLRPSWMSPAPPPQPVTAMPSLAVTVVAFMAGALLALANVILSPFRMVYDMLIARTALWITTLLLCAPVLAAFGYLSTIVATPGERAAAFVGTCLGLFMAQVWAWTMMRALWKMVSATVVQWTKDGLTWLNNT